jgi:hypothetical protein
MLYRTFIGKSSAAAPVCQSEYSTVLNVGNVQKAWRDVSRRVKPQTLWNNPTSQGQASTYLVLYPVEKTITPRVCGGRSYLDESFFAPQIYTSIPSDDAMPWSNILAQKVKGLRLNLASDMAEYREGLKAANTVATDLTKSIAKAKDIVRDIRRGNAARAFRGIRSFGKVRPRKWQEVPASWLGINLALMPAIGTLSSAVDILNNPASSRPVIRKISFSRTVDKETPVYDMWGKKTDSVVRWQQMTRVSAFVSLQSSSLWKDNYTPGNPAEWLWETTPLSIILDWFIPIGNYLSGLDAYSGISGIYGTVSTRLQGSTRGIKRPVAAGKTISPGQLTYRRHVRTAFTQPPSLTIPAWSPSPSVTKLVTALSILAVQRRS